MAKENKTFDFKPLPQIKQTVVEQTVIDDNSLSKVTAFVPSSIIEKMKDWGHWEGMTQIEIINEALNQYFKDKDVKPRPEKVRNRKKVGRKPKIK